MDPVVRQRIVTAISIRGTRVEQYAQFVEVLVVPAGSPSRRHLGVRHVRVVCAVRYAVACLPARFHFPLVGEQALVLACVAVALVEVYGDARAPERKIVPLPLRVDLPLRRALPIAPPVLWAPWIRAVQVCQVATVHAVVDPAVEMMFGAFRTRSRGRALRQRTAGRR